MHDCEVVALLLCIGSQYCGSPMLRGTTFVLSPRTLFMFTDNPSAVLRIQYCPAAGHGGSVAADQAFSAAAAAAPPPAAKMCVGNV